MAKRESFWKSREAYVLTVMPGVALYAVNRYEAGRFAFLGVPSELIDLPAARLILGGAAILAYAFMLWTYGRGLRSFWQAKKMWQRRLGALLTAYLIFGVPVMMLSTTSGGDLFGVVLGLTIGFVWAIEVSNPDASGEAPDRTIGPGEIFVLAIVVLWHLYSLGHWVEKVGFKRTCLAGQPRSLVVASYGDRFVVKDFDDKGEGELGARVVLLEEEMRFIPCRPKIIGEAGIVDYFDKETLRRRHHP